jgi:hypothetical protein
MSKRHSYIVKGFIERGSPHIAWVMSYIEADSIEEAIIQAYGLFKEAVVVSDVTRLSSRSKEDDLQ